MTVSAVNIVLAVIVMVIIPLLVGNALCGILGMKGTLSRSFVVGYIGLWAICELITVPLVLLKQSFMLVVVLFLIIITALIGYGIYNKEYVNLVLQKKTGIEIVGLCVMALAVGYIMLQSVRLQLTNDDDSRFVVNAIDIVRTNRMFLTDVTTGNEISTWIGDLYKDVVSPWAVFAALFSKFTGIHAATMMHTFMPPVLLLLACSVYWLLADAFLEGNNIYKSIFVCVVVLLNIYGYYSIYGVETFLLTRLWQGKSVLAGIGIPMLLLAFIWLYNIVPQRESWRGKVEIDADTAYKLRGAYIFLFMTVIGLGLLSSMSYIITSISIACFGFVYGIAKKDWKMTILIWLSCIPNLICMAISLLIKG